jgi:hypothetical protein
MEVTMGRDLPVRIHLAQQRPIYRRHAFLLDIGAPDRFDLVGIARARVEVRQLDGAREYPASDSRAHVSLVTQQHHQGEDGDVDVLDGVDNHQSP